MDVLGSRRYVHAQAYGMFGDSIRKLIFGLQLFLFTGKSMPPLSLAVSLTTQD